MGNITATELRAIATSVKDNEMRKRKEIFQQWFENEILPICKKIAEKGEFLRGSKEIEFLHQKYILLNFND